MSERLERIADAIERTADELSLELVPATLADVNALARARP